MQTQFLDQPAVHSRHGQRCVKRHLKCVRATHHGIGLIDRHFSNPLQAIDCLRRRHAYTTDLVSEKSLHRPSGGYTQRVAQHLFGVVVIEASQTQYWPTERAHRGEEGHDD